MQRLLSLINYAIDALFPEKCISCSKIGTSFCDDCLSCAPKAGPTENSFITAVFDYKNFAIRHALWRFKYRNSRSIAKYFGRVLYEAIIGEIGDDLHISKKEILLLVPVPLHKKRFHERGYNQSELLAREILKYDTEKIFTLSTLALVRKRNTNPQAQKEKRNARLENLRGAFIGTREIAQKKHIILIDDVTTTGATLQEARKALLKAGAKTVYAFTVAH